MDDEDRKEAADCEEPGECRLCTDGCCTWHPDYDDL
jgi:hypothetical protein